jgi:hypothetical protein
MAERFATIFVDTDDTLSRFRERLQRRLEGNTVCLALTGQSKSVQIKVCHLTSVRSERRELREMLEVADNLVFKSGLCDSTNH